MLDQSPDNKQSVALHRATDLVLKLNTPKGRGVYANRAIHAGEVIDVSPVLVLPAAENREHVEQTVLYHYTYNWPVINADSTLETRQAVVFGLGSMFNHSQEQNVGWQRDAERLFITYYALRGISVGEELCISYGSRLTFEDADVRRKAPSPEQDDAHLLTQIGID